MPIVTIILPSLNVAAYIERCINSVCKQTLQDIEIICVDAGSVDGTYELLKEFAEKDSRIKIVQSDVKSYGAQVNLGIRMAAGKYIGIVETDDYILPKMYQILIEAAEKYDCDYVKGEYQSFYKDSNGKEVIQNHKVFSEESDYNRIIKPVEVIESAVGDWRIWSGIYKKSFLLENNIILSETKGAAYQDIGFIGKTAIFANKACFCAEPFYRYCLDREDSSSNSGRGLSFSYYEFKELIHFLKTNKKWTIETRMYVYAKMAKSFVLCYGDFCDDSDSAWPIEAGLKYYDWFRTELCTAIENGELNEKTVPEYLWRKLNLYLSSSDEYLQTRDVKDKKLRSFIGDQEGVKIIIFGCGNWGITAYYRLLELGYEIYAFIDNNKDLWMKEIEGVRILSPDELPLDNNRILIANEEHCFDIYDQLIKIGTVKKDIFFFR